MLEQVANLPRGTTGHDGRPGLTARAAAAISSPSRSIAAMCWLISMAESCQPALSVRGPRPADDLVVQVSPGETGLGGHFGDGVPALAHRPRPAPPPARSRRPSRSPGRPARTVDDQSDLTQRSLPVRLRPARPAGRAGPARASWSAPGRWPPAGPGPKAAASSVSVAVTRRGDSKSTSVRRSVASSASRRARSPALRGRKPSNTNRSHGSPEMISAVVTADGPGSTVTGSPAAAAAATSR